MISDILKRTIGISKKYIKENQLIVLFLLVFTMGILLGALSLRYFSDAHSNLPLLFQQFISLRTGEFSHILLNSLVMGVVPLLLLYCFGLFMFGYIPCFFLVFVQGIVYGVVSGYLYGSYGLKGVAFVLLIVLPSSFMSTIVYLIGSKIAFRFSIVLSKTYFYDIILAQPSVHIKRYHYKYFILVGLAIVIAFVDSVLSCVFMEVFGF